MTAGILAADGFLFQLSQPFFEGLLLIRHRHVRPVLETAEQTLIDY
jgi:hypothetical protein